MSEQQLVNGIELARALRVTPETVRLWRRAKLIPAIRINPTTIRYDTSEVIAALKSRSQELENAST